MIASVELQNAAIRLEPLARDHAAALAEAAADGKLLIEILHGPWNRPSVTRRSPQSSRRDSYNVAMRALAHTPNIGPRGQQRRLGVGVCALAASAVLAAMLFAFDAPRAWRLVVVAPLWLAGLGLFQAREKT